MNHGRERKIGCSGFILMGKFPKVHVLEIGALLGIGALLEIVTLSKIGEPSFVLHARVPTLTWCPILACFTCLLCRLAMFAFSCPILEVDRTLRCRELVILMPQVPMYVTMSSSEEYREEAAGDIPFPVHFIYHQHALYFIQATPSPVLLLGYVQQVESNLI